jgi:2-hydroxychromene-2-carboxylate isomerase
MTVNVEFLFDFGSPNAYLSHLVIPQIEKRTGMTFVYVPVLLGGVFKATNNVSPAVSLQGVKNKPEYTQLETERFVKKHHITAYARNPFFPVNTFAIMRGAVFAQTAYFKKYVDEVYRHMWAEPKNGRSRYHPSRVDIVGLPTGTFSPAASCRRQTTADRHTEGAVARCFGSPSFFVGRELFFGKDRLREVEEEIEAQKGAGR